MQIRGREINIRFWLSIICVIIILMLLPLSYNDYRETGHSYIDFSNIVFQYYNSIDLNDPELTFFANPTRLLAAICMCIPAIYMNYKLAKSPWSPDRKLSLSVFLGTMILAWYFSQGFPWELRWFLDPGYTWSYLRYLDRFGVMIITFLIIIPFLIREMKIVGDLRQSPVEIIDNVNTKQKVIVENSEKRLSRRYLILGVTLGLIAVILPIQIYTSPGIDYSRLEFYTFFFHISIGNQPIPYQMFRFDFDMVSPREILDQLPYAGFQLLFVFGILHYMQGNLSKKRILLLGVLSLVVPFVYRVSAYIAYNTESEYIIPFPVVLIIGFLVLISVKPIDSTLQTRKQSILSRTRDSIQPPQKDKIQIPFLYVAKSKFSSFLRRISGKLTLTKTHSASG